MRGILYLILLSAAVLGAYFLVPVEKMQSKAKHTIQQVHLSGQSIDFGEITSGLESMLDGKR